MKRSLLPLLLLSCLPLHAQINETALEAVRHMGVGWNLGNTLDANGQTQTDVSNSAYWGGQGLDSETYWGQPYTQPALFGMMRKAGFGAIRVPVTWYNHMDAQGNVSAEWMQRVHQVVDYVIDNGLYCILNVHHDTGADGSNYKSWIKADLDVYNAQKSRFSKLWQQIAEEFKDYDEHLLFEAYNEMLDARSSWCFATMNNYNATEAAHAYDAINGYAQDFVNTVRATGSNNASRNLIVNTYAAACGEGNWNTHLTDPLTQMKRPTDVVADHIIFEVHSYPAIARNGASLTMSDIKANVDDIVSKLRTHLAAKGAPVIIGEWGTSSVNENGASDYDTCPELMKQFMQYFVERCKANDIATFYWMGLTDGMYRSLPAFSQPDLAETITRAYHGSDFQGEYPTPAGTREIVCFEGQKDLGWGNGINISGAAFAAFEHQPVLELTYSHTGTNDDIQLYYGDWSTKLTFQVDGKTYNADFNPSRHYSTPSGTEHTTRFTFDAATYAQQKQRGLIVHGYNIRLTKALLVDPEASALHTVGFATSHTLYDLQGRTVHSPAPGIYIRDGKPIMVR